MVEKITKDDSLWKAELPPERYAILRQAATEPPWTGRTPRRET
jgi:peptide-methionine (R)-S-oxide reductase